MAIDTKSGKIVTLTTDWKQHDIYIGNIKGRLLSNCPGISVIDLAHNVPSFNIQHASFIVSYGFNNFPTGTIHLVMVNSEAVASHKLLVTEHSGHVFVVPDNGIIGLLFDPLPDKVIGVNIAAHGSFASLDGFVNTVMALYNGHGIESLGEITTDYLVKRNYRATVGDSFIQGNIIYFDSYSNAVTNISKSLFDKVGNGRNYNILVQSNYNRIDKLSKTYQEVKEGELLGLFNSFNLLEIAIRNGYAAEMLSLNVGGSVSVVFT